MLTQKRTQGSSTALFLLPFGILFLSAYTLVASQPARPDTPRAPQAAGPANPPVLVPGKWALFEWLTPVSPVRQALLTVANREGKPTLVAVEGDVFQWKPKRLTVTGRRVTFPLTCQGTLDCRFDGLFDPSNPCRVVGSLWYGATMVERATLELVPPARSVKPQRPKAPQQWAKYLELSVEHAQATSEAEGPGFWAKSAAEKVALRAASDAAAERYYREAQKLFRQLLSEQPDSPFGYEVTMALFGLLPRLKPAPAEVEAWANAASRFATTHGPQLEAATLGRIARALARHAEYSALAHAFAAKADKMAKIAEMPADHTRIVAAYDEERAAWATQMSPPPAGTTWGVTLIGRVADPKGVPVPGAEVRVSNMQWATVVPSAEGFKTRTGQDGRYRITLKCQGTFRLHVTRMQAEKPGFIRAEHTEPHKLLSGQMASIDFTLKRGEPLGGTLKLRPDPVDRQAKAGSQRVVLTVTGQGVEETVLATNGEKLTLSLPPGSYTVTVHRGRKKLMWSGLKTGKMDYVFEEVPFRFTPEPVGAAFDELWEAMDRSYSYFILKPEIDWPRLREQYRPKAVAAKSASELAEVLSEMLGHLKDGHIWIELPDGKVVGTHRAYWAYNGNRKILRAQLTDLTECGQYAVVGKTKPDGFGYFLMIRQSEATPELVARAAAAIRKLADAPGFVIDLRNANGGSEPLAREIAGLFCGRKVVYAKSRFRAGKGHDEFTEDYPRELLPAKSGEPYLKPVVCLLGPGCVSSGEGFAKMMAALPHVITVGLPTRGSSGNPAAAAVGETGLLVYFSRWVDLLPNGTPIEGKGVPVAIRVDRPTDVYRSSDPTLERGLDVLRNAIRKTRPK